MGITLTLNLWYNADEKIPAFADAPELGWSPHPQKAMKHLGITYRDCDCSSMAECWWFYDCQNVPEVLPKWLSRTDE